MQKQLITDSLVLRCILRDIRELTTAYNDVFNKCDSQDLKHFLNDLTPDLIAAQMKVQDKLRILEKEMTPISKIAETAISHF